ncbi:MAG: DUF1491 family protein [Beijerinckiaceae bacterium]|jgi:hypothetical protein|nr:DUF1491 family protein [Beijerinckiaceae bacterium]
MRLASEFFVSATIRRAELGGAFAALRRRGGSQSGAIFVLVDRLDGTCTLYGPAPQALYEGGDSERAFTRLHAEETVAREVAEARLDKEIRFDPDVWILEIEARDGKAFLDRIL